MMASTTLYTYALSPYGMKVYWALVYKQMPFRLQYVSPRDQKELSFTNQKIVPVVQIGDEWRLDSGPICCWLDEHCEGRPLSGSTCAERQLIVDADNWVTKNVIGLSFRAIIDNDASFSAFRNGRKLAQVMRSTSGGVPRWAQFVWVNLLRRTEFVVNDANQISRETPLAECRKAIAQKVEGCIERTGFLADTGQPSYADISLFAQLACNATFGLEGALSVFESPVLSDYYKRLAGYMNLDGMPDLVPGWQPFGVTRT